MRRYFMATTIALLLFGCANENQKTNEETIVVAASNLRIEPSVSGIAFDSATKTKQLMAVFEPSNATDKSTITWSIDANSPNDVATVSPTGLVTALTEGGPLLVIAKSADGKFIAKSKIMVTASTVEVTDVKVTPTVHFAKIGSVQQLRAIVTPNDATEQAVIWKSETPAVATIDKWGKFTAKANGVVKITATVGSKTAEAKLIVGDLEMRVFPVQMPSGGKIFAPNGAVNNAFSIAATETTYALWTKIYLWATTPKSSDDTKRDADAGPIYKFTPAPATETKFYKGGKANEALDAFTENTDGSDLQPIVKLNWYDAIVWCNAYTEYMNQTQNTTLTAVYVDGTEDLDGDSSTPETPKPIRDATQATVLDALTVTDFTKTGFRLPAQKEWLFASRFHGEQNASGTTKKDSVFSPNWEKIAYYFTNSDIASGASAKTLTEINSVAWSKYNSFVENFYRTHDVGLKRPNFLGLYDMSGNAGEWGFEKSSTSRTIYGYGYNSQTIDSDANYSAAPSNLSATTGFRLVRSEEK